MSIKTFSVFYPTVVVNSANQFLNFDEGGGELSASVAGGSYTLTDLSIAIKTALDAVGGLVYTVALDRDTRQLTISSTANFSLLIGTGTQIGSALWTDMGFTGGVDLTGASTYTSGSGAGFEYQPQFVLQDYIESRNYKEKISPTVNESASGKIEVVSFGVREFFEMSFKFITNITMDGKIIKNNPNGESDFRSFMDNIIEKGEIEFMPDIDNRGAFFKVLLETAPGNAKGTGYKLNELLGKNLPGFYELNKIKMRVV